MLNQHVQRFLHKYRQIAKAYERWTEGFVGTSIFGSEHNENVICLAYIAGYRAAIAQMPHVRLEAEFNVDVSVVLRNSGVSDPDFQRFGGN